MSTDSNYTAPFEAEAASEPEIVINETALAVADPIPMTELGDISVFSDNVLTEYFSGDPTTDEGREAYYKCLTEADARVSEMINKTILVRDIYAAKVKAHDNDTGEIKILTRIVLIDTDNCTYACSSAGVRNSLNAIFRSFGKPSWPNGLPLTVRQKSLKNGGNILTLAYNPNK